MLPGLLLAFALSMRAPASDNKTPTTASPFLGKWLILVNSSP